MLVKIKTLNNRSKFLLALALVIFAIGIFLITKTYQDNQTKPQQITENPGMEDVNLQPPTDEEKQQAIANKERIIADQERLKNIPSVGSQKTKVSPIISLLQQSGQQIETGGYITGIFEEGGSCNTTFSRNGVKLTRQAASIREGSSTYCPMVSINVVEFSGKGTWNVILSYESNTASGSSDKQEIEVR